MKCNIVSFLNTFEKLAEINRKESYFTLISVIISIAIFSAGIINSEKKSIEKRMIVNNLDINKTIYLSISLLFAIWVEPIIKEGNYFGECFVLFLEIALNMAILYSYIKSIVLMYRSMKLSSNDIHYFEKLRKYIENRTLQIEKDSNNIENKIKISDDVFNKKIKNYDCLPYEIGNFILKEDYVSLLANFEGFVSDININALPKKRFNRSSAENNSVLYICNKVGEYVYRGDAVCYCHKEYEDEYKNTKKYFKINENRLPYKKQYYEIIDWYFANSVVSDGVFDSDNSIKQYIVYLYQNECKKGLGIIINTISDYYYKIRNNVLQLKQYYYFVKSIRRIALKNKDFEAYSILDDLILSCYYVFINSSNDEDVIDSIKSSFSMEIYELKSKDSKYYDYTLSNYLKLIYYQIRERKYKNVYELIEDNNTLFNRYETKNEDIKIINLAFISGLIKGLLTKKNEVKFEDDSNKTLIRKIFEHIMDENDDVDGFNIVEKFRKIPNKSPHTYRVLDNCEMYIDKHKNGVIFGVNTINDIELLANLLNIYGTIIFFENKYENSEYKKEDRYFYEQFKEIIEGKKYDTSIIDNVLANDTVIKYLDFSISKCLEKEKIYIINTKIDDSIFKNYENKIRSEIFKIDGLLSILNNYSKIEYVSKTIHGNLSLNYYLPRELFLNYDSYADILIDPFRNSFDVAIVEKYCMYINNCFKSFDELKQIEDVIDLESDYLFFINEDLYYEKYYNIIKENKIEIKNKEFICYYESNDIVGIKAIKIDDLPTIRIDKECSNNDIKHIKKGIYIETFDLANNEDKRNAISKLQNDKETLLTKVLLNALINIEIE